MVEYILYKLYLSKTENHFKIGKIFLVVLGASKMCIVCTFSDIWAKSRIPWDAEISVHMVATGSDAYITPNRRCEEDAFTYCAAS